MFMTDFHDIEKDMELDIDDYDYGLKIIWVV